MSDAAKENAAAAALAAAIVYTLNERDPTFRGRLEVNLESLLIFFDHGKSKDAGEREAANTIWLAKRYLDRLENET
ncbi:MAG: hypothetical protein F4Y91_10820 [Gemmatimonadetes bacterium]|nr:hypothetical protein [Gemmatimonadota bacterium]MXY82533.1 hypothetical protein [Gemmatimonadota bacterium]MYB69660.1 hypothetical protein [Gemmatimonadota bacterium]